MPNTIKVNFKMGQDPGVDTVVVQMIGTVIDLDNAIHHTFMEALLQFVAGEMVAHVQGIPIASSTGYVHKNKNA